MTTPTHDVIINGHGRVQRGSEVGIRRGENERGRGPGGQRRLEMEVSKCIPHHTHTHSHTVTQSDRQVGVGYTQCTHSEMGKSERARSHRDTP